jgi:hypothetical protein
MREADGQPPIITTKHPGTRSCKPPLCAACCLDKALTQGSDTYRTIPNPKKIHSLVRDDLKPGDRVSLDQYVSSVPGRLVHTYGKEKKRDKLTGETIFVDHATGHVFIYKQVSARTGETLIDKKKYERLTLDSGVSVQNYHADNGIFATKAFRSHCDYKGQELEFSGVGAQHQNGVAERAIQTVSSLALTMLLHMSLHWPKQADLELWPFALQHAACLWNHLPLQTLTWPLRNSTQVPSLSATTILLACTPSVAPYILSTPTSKMDTKFKSGNLGLVADNS